MEQTNQNSNTKNPYDLTFDSVITEILNVLPLHLDSVVLSGLYLVEQYYAKVKRFSYVNTKDKIEIFVFGSEQTILEKVNQIVNSLHTIKKFGSLSFIENSEKKIIRLKFAKLTNFIMVNCYDCANANELLNRFETANEMMYWTPATGLVINPFAKMSFEINQVMRNFKFKGDIPNQKLFNLKTIGFELTEYIKDTLFVPNDNLSVSQWVNNGWYVEFTQEIFTKRINETNIKKFIIYQENPQVDYTNYLGKFDISSLKMSRTVNKLIPYSKNKSVNHNMILLRGWVSQVIKMPGCVYLSFFVSDNEIAYKLVQVFNFYKRSLESHETYVPVIDTSFFTENKLEPLYKLSRNTLDISKNLLDYSKEKNLGLLCKLFNTTDIYDTRARIFGKSGRVDCHDIPSNTPMYMWVSFFSENPHLNILTTDVKLIVI